MTEWSMDRRAFLKAAGVLSAGLAMKPSFAWSAAGDTLRIRMEGDLQCLDPAFMNGGIEDVMMRGIYVSLNHFGDIRKGSVALIAAVAGDGATAAVAAVRYLQMGT